METKNGKDSHRSTSRVLDVLELVCGARQGYTLSELCLELDVPKSSMFPLVHTLCGRGYLQVEPQSMRYRIGPMAFQVGSSYLDGYNIMDEIVREMQKVVEACGETCHLGALRGGEVFYVRKVDSPEPIRMTSIEGKSMPAYATALGKALLVDLDSRELKKLYYDGLVPLTEYTITSFGALAAQLRAARDEGVVYECEESNRFIRCVALPVRRHGAIAAALSVAIPTFRFTKEKEDEAKAALLEAKGRIETLIESVDIQF